jgi:hypothetical protein
MMAAAPVMSRPMRSSRRAAARRLPRVRRYSSLDAAEQKDLVVHRKTEDDAEEDQRQRRIDRRRGEAELFREIPS